MISVKGAPLSWSTTHEVRLVTTNRELNMAWHQRSPVIRDMRGAFQYLAIQHGNVAPRFKVPVVVTWQPEYRPGPTPDTDGAYLATKAALDGLVEARVLPNDTREWVRRIIHEAPLTTERDALTVTLTAVT